MGHNGTDYAPLACPPRAGIDPFWRFTLSARNELGYSRPLGGLNHINSIATKRPDLVHRPVNKIKCRKIYQVAVSTLWGIAVVASLYFIKRLKLYCCCLIKQSESQALISFVFFEYAVFVPNYFYGDFSSFPFGNYRHGK